MIPSSACPPWHADHTGPAGQHGDQGRKLHHAVGQHLILMNKACGSLHGDRPQIYAHALIDTVKTAINRFQKAQRIRNIGNVEVITDLNAQNAHAQFRQVIDAAMNADGRFKAVNSVSPIDSSASRMLQLADIVAHSRSWLKKPDTDAKRLREVFGIEIV